MPVFAGMARLLFTLQLKKGMNLASRPSLQGGQTSMLKISQSLFGCAGCFHVEDDDVCSDYDCGCCGVCLQT